MSKTLVAYFSATGTTGRAAKLLAQATGSDLFEIRPAVPYTGADLNWNNKKSRSSVEMDDPNSRPELAEPCPDLADYGTVFLGFPIWWYTAPTIINTFLESGNFSGRRIVLFATSGSSGLGGSARSLKVSVAPDTEILDGRMMNGKLSEKELSSWAAQFLK